MKIEEKTILWKPVSEYTGGRVLATNGLDILIGELNPEGDCVSEDCSGIHLCGITHFAKIDGFFPELAESEDERIRKEIMDFIDTKTIDSDERRNRWFSYLEKYKPIPFVSLEDTKVKMSLMQYILELNQDVVHLHPGIETCNEWIAWLEKQGEFYTKRDVDNAYIEGMAFAKDELEKQGKQKGYTFKSIPRLLDMIEPSDKANAYCQKLIDALAKEGYNTDAKIVEEVLKGWNGEDVPMAIMDEQKPVFEMKTPEESLGIDSDTYNKIVDECIYGEQKSTELAKGEDYGIDGLWHAQRILEKTLGEVDGYQTDDGILDHKAAITAVKKLYEQEPTDNEMKEALRTEYEKGRADAIAEIQNPVDCIDCTNSKGCINCEDGNMKETLVQKPAWSEEDECYMSECIGAIATKDGWSFEEKRKTKHWLKSLKDRVQPRRRHTIFDEII